MMKLVKYMCFGLACCCSYLVASAQRSAEAQISDSLTKIANSITYLGKINVVNISIKNDKVVVVASDKLAQIPFRNSTVESIYSAIRNVLKENYNGQQLICETEGKRIEELIPNYFRRVDAIDSTRLFRVEHPKAFVSNISRLLIPASGLEGRNIALWQSHGRFYDQKKARWQWQRARVMQTVEDLYTQSYVLPYLVPMLENAGAYVLLPRERDFQINEIIVDNDTSTSSSRYREYSEQNAWDSGSGKGFAHIKSFYLFGENPFRFGTYRQSESVQNIADESKIEWIPNIENAGRYAVYISYKSLPNSSTDAHYTICHKAGKTSFVVNQKMGGGTWIFLGFFNFDKGRSSQSKVVLSNYSTDSASVITADAIKIGGGMGNIARMPLQGNSLLELKTKDSIESPTDSTKLTISYEPELSNYPRYTEGARYWLQWAGISDSIYSRTHNKNDYSDDFQSRGFWVNYLVGGSTIAPTAKGLNIPVDMALAFHTDAGTTTGDSIIGTLGICTVQNSDGATVFKNGYSRWASRDVTDIIQSQIVNDIQALHAKEWIRRGIWNKSYSESRVPFVPTMLLELLSHQNLSDMRYGHDPEFKFDVSRAIYKGMLKFISSCNGLDYVVQPLPVKKLSLTFLNQYLKLRWKAVVDSLEPTAIARKYIVYTRIDDGEFDQGTVVDSCFYKLKMLPGKIYSFKVTAVNDGGESFPSEIVSACQHPNAKSTLLVVNGFERIAPPASYDLDGKLAGFDNVQDPGVAYMKDVSFVGCQYENKRQKAYENDDAPGFGASYANFETSIASGNTFDYIYTHGRAISQAGYSFVSCSMQSLVEGDVSLKNYKLVDVIYGAQKQTVVGNPKNSSNFRVFSPVFQAKIKEYCKGGGNVLISGAYLASDCYLNNLTDDQEFVETTLGVKYRTNKASVNGEVKVLSAPLKSVQSLTMQYNTKPNFNYYYIPSSDAIEPFNKNAVTICRYMENNLSAGVFYKGNYQVCTLGFPFEIILDDKKRDLFMAMILKSFFETDVRAK